MAGGPGRARGSAWTRPRWSDRASLRLWGRLGGPGTWGPWWVVDGGFEPKPGTPHQRAGEEELGGKSEAGLCDRAWGAAGSGNVGSEANTGCVQVWSGWLAGEGVAWSQVFPLVPCAPPFPVQFWGAQAAMGASDTQPRARIPPEKQGTPISNPGASCFITLIATSCESRASCQRGPPCPPPSVPSNYADWCI